MKFVLVFSFLLLSAPVAHAGHGKILSFNEVIKLHKKDRHKYLKVLAKNLIKLSPETKDFSVLEILGVYTKAYAEAYRGVCGGVPVPDTETNCGANSYAGFTCPAGQEICNPFIFGVKNETTPVCFNNATTKKCYQNAAPGKNTTTDPVFNKPGAKEDYEKFRGQIERICSGSVDVVESVATRDEACGKIEKQTEINRRRNLVGFVDDAPLPEVTEPARDPYDIIRPAGAPALTYGAVDDDELGGGERTTADTTRYTGNPGDYPIAGSPAVEGLTVGESYFKNSAQYEEFKAKLGALLEKNPELKKSQKAVEHALAFFYKHKDGGMSCGGDPNASSNLKNQEWINVTDYTIPSSKKRMFYINMKTGDVVSSHAAHGSGSGRGSIPTNIGDQKDSNKTSGGFFETKNVYTSMKCVSNRSNGSCRRSVIRPTFGGKPNNSLKLRGLLPSNKNAFVRGVVHHGATYVSNSRAGLSWGCPAPTLSTFKKMRYEIDQGALMYLHTTKQDKLNEPEC